MNYSDRRKKANNTLVSVRLSQNHLDVLDRIIQSHGSILLKNRVNYSWKRSSPGTAIKWLIENFDISTLKDHEK